MSIPERFYRIAKHKLNEIKDRIDQWDDEAQRDVEERPKRPPGRADARRELDGATVDSAPARTSPTRPDVAPAPLRRTPEEIAGGTRAVSTAPATSCGADDSLERHYRLLGVEPGVEFAAVHEAYNRYSARCDPARFPAGSAEAEEAHRIRLRLNASYKTLRDQLDPTARRFDLLEFDSSPAASPKAAS